MVYTKVTIRKMYKIGKFVWKCKFCVKWYLEGFLNNISRDVFTKEPFTGRNMVVYFGSTEYSIVKFSEFRISKKSWQVFQIVAKILGGGHRFRPRCFAAGKTDVLLVSPRLSIAALFQPPFVMMSSTDLLGSSW